MPAALARPPIAIAPLLLPDAAVAFCPYLSSSIGGRGDDAPQYGQRARSLYDSLSYISEGGGQACPGNCFVNDGGNLDTHHYADGGSAVSTFDIMSKLSEEDGGAAMCVFSFQELRLPDDGISDENLLELIYLGDLAGGRLQEATSGDGDGGVLLAACTLGAIGARQACSNAKKKVEGYEYHATDDDGLSGTRTYYEERFCKPAVRKTKIDHPHAITIFRLGADSASDAAAALEEFREAHATSIRWAQNTGIGSEGHLLAKVVPCDRISGKFRDPTGMYADLADGNSVCDYVGGNGRQLAEEALKEWEGLCSAWPLDEDGNPPKCGGATAAGVWAALLVGFAIAVGAGVFLKRQRIFGTRPPENLDRRRLVAELSQVAA